MWRIVWRRPRDPGRYPLRAMELRTNCDRCGTQILKRTANRHGGKCVPCSQRSSELSTALHLAVEIVCIPFHVAHAVVLAAWRRIHFPHDFSEIEPRLQEIYPNSRDARNYRRNVIRGFFSPILGAMTSDPWNLPAVEGQMDGSRLVLNELEFESLPTRQFPFAPDKWADNKAVNRSGR